MNHSYAPWSNPPYRYPSMFVSSLLLFCLRFVLLTEFGSMPFPRVSFRDPPLPRHFFIFLLLVLSRVLTTQPHRTQPRPVNCKSKRHLLHWPSPVPTICRPPAPPPPMPVGGGSVPPAAWPRPTAATAAWLLPMAHRPLRRRAPRVRRAARACRAASPAPGPSLRRRRCRCRPMLKDGTTIPSSSSSEGTAAQQQEPPRRRL